MSKIQEIKNIIDRVVGNKGNLNIPSWWMNKILTDITNFVGDGGEKYSELNDTINNLSDKINNPVQTIELLCGESVTGDISFMRDDNIKKLKEWEQNGGLKCVYIDGHPHNGFNGISNPTTYEDFITNGVIVTKYDKRDHCIKQCLAIVKNGFVYTTNHQYFGKYDFNDNGFDVSCRNDGSMYIELKSVVQIVSELPQKPENNKIYLVPSVNPAEGNKLTEWVYVNDQWEQFGEFKTNVDLSNYVQSSDFEIYTGVIDANLENLRTAINAVDDKFKSYITTTDATTAIESAVDGVENTLNEKIDSVADNSLKPLIKITYEELVILRDAGQLIPGQQYRITNYATATVQNNTQSAGHQFDIIVTADGINVLNENARACRHDGDVYFTDSNIEAWELKYCLDNDDKRFAWSPNEPERYYVGHGKEESFGSSDTPSAPYNYSFEVTLTDEVFDAINNKLGISLPSKTLLFEPTMGSIFGEMHGVNGFHYCYEGKYDNNINNRKNIAFKADIQNTTWKGVDYIEYDLYVYNGDFYTNYTNATKLDISLKDCEIKAVVPLERKQHINIKVKVTDKLRKDFYNYFGRTIDIDEITLYCRTRRAGYHEGEPDMYYADIYNNPGLNIVAADDQIMLAFSPYELPKSGKLKTFTYKDYNGHLCSVEPIWLMNGQPTEVSADDIYVTVIDNGYKHTPVKKSVGKGVIYYMKDEWNNECPYDFKNIQFARWELSNPVGYINDYDIDNEEDNWVEEYTPFDSLKTGFYGLKSLRNKFVYGYNDEYGYDKYRVEYTIPDSPTYCYTFGKDTDYSIDGSSYGNVIKEYKNSNNEIHLNNIVFLGNECYYNSFSDYCYDNTFGEGCFYNSFGNKSRFNTFGNNCEYNTFVDGCGSNSFGNSCINNSFGHDCQYNSFGNECFYNTFGNSCESNSLGYSCSSNSFGDGCSYNSFGNECRRNSFGNNCECNSFGNNCEYNSFGDSCSYNNLGYQSYSNSFGDFCHSNSFGYIFNSNNFRNSCYSNSFGNGCIHNSFGEYCHSNSFGNNCNSNSFGEYCYSNSFGNSCNNNSFGNGCNYNSFRLSQDLTDDKASGDKVDYARNVHYGDGCNNIVLYVNPDNVGTINGTNSIRNINVAQGLVSKINGGDSPTFVELTTTGQDYEIKVARNSDGDIKVFCLADLIA